MISNIATYSLKVFSVARPTFPMVQLFGGGGGGGWEQQASSLISNNNCKLWNFHSYWLVSCNAVKCIILEL